MIFVTTGQTGLPRRACGWAVAVAGYHLHAYNTARAHILIEVRAAANASGLCREHDAVAVAKVCG